MEIYKEIPKLKSPTCVAIGKFDGVHLGHLSLLEELVLIAETQEKESVVFTFDPFPEEYFAGTELPRINTKGEVISQMDEIGIDRLVRVPFDRNLAQTDPEDFVKNILKDALKARVIVCGSDVTFGKDKKGDCKLLLELGKKYGIHVEIIDKVEYDKKEISSSRIIFDLAAGNIEEANEMLGYDYYLYGPVVKGEALGRQFNLPTANINPPKGKIVPKNGVYCTIVETEDGDEYRAVTNVGIRPTVSDEGTVNIESHLLTDEDIDLYQKRINVYFLHFIREEMKFDTKKDLFRQIETDVKTAKDFFEN